MCSEPSVSYRKNHNHDVSKAPGQGSSLLGVGCRRRMIRKSFAPDDAPVRLVIC